MAREIVDVLVIGAGVSGIGMACRLKSKLPGKTFKVLDRRARIGGTWDLFRYPGVRSDSDMYTFGYQFRPWRSYQTLADGDSIRQYLVDTAEEYEVANNIDYQLKCESANWDSEQQCWTVSATHEPSGETRQYQARFLVSASGYYNYDHGYRPYFKNEEQFGGQIIHPQQWPEGLNYEGKKVVVIGSGATAVTLVPSMADQAAKVTMLQRSPTYIYSLPGWDRITEVLDKVLPRKVTYALARKRNLEMWQTTYKLCRRYPKAMRKFFTGQAKRLLGDKYTETDFNPSYQPWDQRLCAVPDANLYKAIRSDKAEVVTDTIAKFTENGILLNSGREIEADIVISATGLSVQLFGGMAMSVDGVPYDASKKMAYKSVLMQDLPNYAWIFGYINLSWTMKADMSSLYVCRLLEHMDEQQQAVVTPRDKVGMQLKESVMAQLNAGYVKRAEDTLPRQGKASPWIVLNNYKQDKQMMLHTTIADQQCLETEPAKSGAKTKGERDAA